jgi:hypothetical protein
MSGSLVRSIVAVVVGFLVIGALSVGTTKVLELNGMVGPGGQTSDAGMLLLMQAYVAVYAIAGCWLAAYLAPAKPMRHALTLGVLGLLFNIMGAAQQWDLVPAWYWALSLALVVPYAWLGGRLRELQLQRGGATARA